MFSIFSNYKTLDQAPYQVTINEHEHVLHIQRSYMYTFAGTAIAGQDCVDVHTLHMEYTRSDRLPSMCASAITRIQTHHSV